MVFIIVVFGTASLRWCKHTTKFRIHNTWIKNNLKNVDTSVKNPPSIYLTYGLKSFNFDLAVVLRPAWADAKPTRRGKVKYCSSKEKTKETTQSSCSLSLNCVKQKPRRTNAYVGVFSLKKGTRWIPLVID